MSPVGYILVGAAVIIAFLLWRIWADGRQDAREDEAAKHVVDQAKLDRAEFEAAQEVLEDDDVVAEFKAWTDD